MKKSIFVLILAICSFGAYSQWGLTYHRSYTSQVGVNYQIGNRFLPEFRIQSNTYVEDVSYELQVNYLFIKSQNVEAYAGLGGRVIIDEGVVVPIGINIYPFETKQFGFHTELAFLVGEYHDILRNSWGIRYRFNKKEN